MMILPKFSTHVATKIYKLFKNAKYTPNYMNKGNITLKANIVV